ncbi:MAG: hypothetical protein ACXWWO_01735 [Candidatus Limnocylindria bacterium]
MLDLLNDAAGGLWALFSAGMPNSVDTGALAAGTATTTTAAGAAGSSNTPYDRAGPDDRITQDRERLRQAREALDPRNSPGAREAREEAGGGPVAGAPVRPPTGGGRPPTSTTRDPSGEGGRRAGNAFRDLWLGGSGERD